MTGASGSGEVTGRPFMVGSLLCARMARHGAGPTLVVDLHLPSLADHRRQEVAVVVDIADYWHLKGDVTDFKDYLRAGADFDELELSRTTEGPRDTDWVNDA